MPTVEANVVWKDKLRFSGTGGRNGAVVALDSAAAGEASRGATPMETVLIALGGCTGMDVISILQKMRQDVTSYEVRLTGERAAEHPRVYTEILVRHVVRGRRLDRASVERAVNLSETKYCSVSNMLAKGVNIRFEVEVLDEPVSVGARKSRRSLAGG
jgi:putative redox protein